jgi:uncharacterized protein YjbI with pentapeptide repeats
LEIFLNRGKKLFNFSFQSFEDINFQYYTFQKKEEQYYFTNCKFSNTHFNFIDKVIRFDNCVFEKFNDFSFDQKLVFKNCNFQQANIYSINFSNVTWQGKNTFNAVKFYICSNLSEIKFEYIILHEDSFVYERLPENAYSEAPSFLRIDYINAKSSKAKK